MRASAVFYSESYIAIRFSFQESRYKRGTSQLSGFLEKGGWFGRLTRALDRDSEASQQRIGFGPKHSVTLAHSSTFYIRRMDEGIRSFLLRIIYRD